MSFSFSTRASSPSEVRANVSTELDTIVAAQPIHDGDRDNVTETVSAMLDLLTDDDSRDIAVAASGSVTTVDGEDGYSSVSLSVSVSLVAREEQTGEAEEEKAED